MWTHIYFSLWVTGLSFFLNIVFLCDIISHIMEQFICASFHNVQNGFLLIN